MIPNHKEFIEAIKEKKKVCLRLYSKADSGVIDLVCAPLDYGPTGLIQDGVNRYRLWDYTSNNGTHILALLPEQILDLSVLGAVFDPTEFGAPPPAWSIPRDWATPSGVGTRIPSAGPAQTETQPGSSEVSHLVNN
jgi:hypothetical protein